MMPRTVMHFRGLFRVLDIKQDILVTSDTVDSNGLKFSESSTGKSQVNHDLATNKLFVKYFQLTWSFFIIKLKSVKNIWSLRH